MRLILVISYGSWSRRGWRAAYKFESYVQDRVRNDAINAISDHRPATKLRYQKLRKTEGSNATRMDQLLATSAQQQAISSIEKMVLYS